MNNPNLSPNSRHPNPARLSAGHQAPNTPSAEFKHRFPELYQKLEDAIADLPSGITVELGDKTIITTWKQGAGNHYRAFQYTDDDVRYLIRLLADGRTHYEFLDLTALARQRHFRVRNFHTVHSVSITIPKAHHIPLRYADEVRNNEPVTFCDTPEDVAILREILGLEPRKQA